MTGRTGAPGSRTWRETHDDLRARPPESLSADEHDRLADALFWLDDVDASLAVRAEAYASHARSGAHRGAAQAAWRLFYDHFLVGETAPANGWLERCADHVRHLAPDDAEVGWLALARADVAARAGAEATALAHATEATRLARIVSSPDLLAMALQAEGRARIAAGDTGAGMVLLDESMVCLVAGDIADLYVGWVYCNVISTCYQLADLDRAGQWSQAALRWCETLDSGRMYPGLCRVYAAELSCARGAWSAAEAEARRACDELTAFDPRYAGAAFHLVGELCRLRGDPDGARSSFERAHELGWVPQPGLALLVAAQGRPREAAAMLRTALAAGGLPLPRARLLVDLVDLELRLGAAGEAVTHAEELEALASASGARVIDALSTGTIGRVDVARGRPEDGYRRLASAVGQLADLGLPYEAARFRLSAGAAAAEAGDAETARLEVATARAAFQRLGAVADLAAAESELRRLAGPAEGRDGGLTRREVEVLRLVAAGATNREAAAELHLSPHTVNRHVSNIYAKLGVSSRAAATARAYETGIVDDRSS